MTTHVIYQHPSVSVHFENGNYSMRASSVIESGTLILLEHMVVGSSDFVVQCVQCNRSLFEELHPRIPEATALQKCNMNTFGREEDEIILGKTCSKFNHACIPSCIFRPADKVLIEHSLCNIDVFGVWTVKTVKVGDELCLDYTKRDDNCLSVEEHEIFKSKYEFGCSCSVSDIESSYKRAVTIGNIGRMLYKRDEKRINTIVDEYARTDAAKSVVKNQALIMYGLKLGLWAKHTP